MAYGEFAPRRAPQVGQALVARYAQDWRAACDGELVSALADDLTSALGAMGDAESASHAQALADEVARRQEGRG